MPTDAVTGATSYTGRFIGARLVASDRRVIDLTRRARSPHPLGSLAVSAAVEHGIVRPTITFGPGDILVNNLAWTLRRLPAFGIPGDGQYGVHPVHIDDIADLSVRVGSMTGNVTVDAAGPDVLAFDEFVSLVRSAVGSQARLVHMPAWAALAAARFIGLLVRDVVLTRDEIAELRSGLMTSSAPPTGRVRLAGWLAEHGDALGRAWASELDRHFRRP